MKYHENMNKAYLQAFCKLATEAFGLISDSDISAAMFLVW